MKTKRTSRVEPSLYWYDTETTGIDRTRDRVVQFASQRTNFDLKPIGKPFIQFVKLPPEILPDPEALCVTKISPQKLKSDGVDEWELFHHLNQDLCQGNTCIIGYNNIGFDDIFLRFGMWRNLLPPYRHEFHRGNARLDLLNILRLACALRPDGMNWPYEDGYPKFSLSAISEANDIPTQGAHDALVDVELSIKAARLLKRAQSRLWKYCLSLRERNTARKLIDRHFGQPILHVSQFYSNQRYCIAPVVPITFHPVFSNRVICVDLLSNVSLLGKSSDEIAARQFAPASEPQDRPGIVVIPLNQSPVVAPYTTLKSKNFKRLNINPKLVKANLKALQSFQDLDEKLHMVYAKQPEMESASIAEEALYDGFISKEDEKKCELFWRQVSKNKGWSKVRFDDHRLNHLYSRLKVRKAPSLLSKSEQLQHRKFVCEQLTGEKRNFNQVLESTQALLRDDSLDLQIKPVLRDYELYLNEIAQEYLHTNSHSN